MSKQHELFVGQKFRKKIDGSTIEIEIIALSASEVTLKVTGKSVGYPNEPRVIPICGFVSWEGAMPNA